MKETLLKLLVAIALVFAPIKATLLTVMVLVLADLVMGLAAAIKERQAITSTGLKRTIMKVFVYEGVVCLSYLVGTFMTGPSVPVVNIAAGYIGITELKSILENVEAISGVNLLQAIIDKLNPSKDQ